MTIQVAHVFYEVFMGWSHDSLLEVMANSAGKSTLEKDEMAIFINKSWTACKLLVAGKALIYYRAPSGMLSLEAIRTLPMKFGGRRLDLSSKLENNMLATFKKQMKDRQAFRDLKLAYA